MKAVSLPVNMIIIFLIAIVVLAVASVFFMGGMIEQETEMSKSEALNKGCVIWRATDCNTAWDSIKVGEITLKAACAYAGLEQEACIKYCCGGE
jgi:hypothetical protein